LRELGEGLALKDRKTVELKEEFANSFLEYAEFSSGDEKIDRKLMMNWVEYLARQMESGSFRWEQVNLITCSFEGRVYRMNGQHTCWARINAELPKGTRTPVQWLRYEAQTFDDMRMLYATIDRGKARGMQTVVTSYLSGREEFPDFKKGLLARLAEGLSLWLWENQNVRTLHTGDERAYLLLKDHHKAAVAIGQFFQDSTPKSVKHLYRASCIGAMFGTFSKFPHVAKEFWTAVRDGEMLQKKDPRFTLREYLLTSKVSKTNINAELRVVSSEEAYRACLIAWNAHRQGRQLQMLAPGRLNERPEIK
jgi:hypothetical protein